MNYQHFVVEVKEKVEHFLGDSLHVEIMTTIKNNGTERVGLSISDPAINISPTIYLEEFYESYQTFLTIDEIAMDIVDLYAEVRFDHNLEVDDIQNFNQAKPKLAYKLINAAQNEALLKKIPHKLYYEFAIVFFMFFDADPYNQGTILITNDLLKLWNTNSEEIYEIAHKNMPKLLPISLIPMEEMMCELLHQNQVEFFEDSPLYILTNMQRTFGAAAFVYDGVFEKIARRLGENFYILPSSIHELIIIPESRSPQKEKLDAMIKEVNKTQLLPEEMLGERTYYYDYLSKVLS